MELASTPDTCPGPPTEPVPMVASPKPYLYSPHPHPALLVSLILFFAILIAEKMKIASCQFARSPCFFFWISACFPQSGSPSSWDKDVPFCIFQGIDLEQIPTNLVKCRSLPALFKHSGYQHVGHMWLGTALGHVGQEVKPDPRATAGGYVP